MKKLVLLFAALLVAGCGEKSSSEGSESASEKPTPSNESAEPSADTAQSSSDSVTLPLSDADVERLVKEAVDLDSLEERDDLYYQTNESEPYSGWVKNMWDSEQVRGLVQLKAGKPAGPFTAWHENGQKWHEETYKDGEKISEKYWNSKGEEVETREEAEAAESPSEEPSETPNSLSDADLERLLEEAVDYDSLEERGDLSYQVNESEPYSGWVKEMYDSGQVWCLGRSKDGKPDGLTTMWHENGQKSGELTFKDGKREGLSTEWHENGQKAGEVTFKDGKRDGLTTTWYENGQKAGEATFKDDEVVSVKFWNSEGEEVETEDESRK